MRSSELSHGTATVVTRPRLRGRSHQIAFTVTLVTGPVLVVHASTLAARAAAGVYALALSSLFGVSALLHRHTWAPAALRRMRRLDHSMIFVAIAGTYTPIATLALEPPLSAVILSLVWVATVAGVAVCWCGLTASRWLTVLPYLGVGWMAVLALPELVTTVGATGLAYIVAGGVLYSAGAVVYTCRRPDPVPAVFGYHEVFHLLVVVAAALHYTAIAVYVTPRA